MSHYFAEYTHFLCVNIQKWIAECGYSWRCVEEFSYFTVTSNKRCVTVHPKQHGIEIKSDDILTEIASEKDIKVILQKYLNHLEGSVEANSQA
jgi:hypothetical protein